MFLDRRIIKPTLPPELKPHIFFALGNWRLSPTRYGAAVLSGATPRELWELYERKRTTWVGYGKHI